MKRFKSRRQAQSFLSIHDQVANLFHIPYPERTRAPIRRALRERAFAVWRRDLQIHLAHDKRVAPCRAFMYLAHVNLTVPAVRPSRLAGRRALSSQAGRRSALRVVTRWPGGLWCKFHERREIGGSGVLWIRRQHRSPGLWRVLPVVLSLLNAN